MSPLLLRLYRGLSPLLLRLYRGLSPLLLRLYRGLSPLLLRLHRGFRLLGRCLARGRPGIGRLLEGRFGRRGGLRDLRLCPRHRLGVLRPATPVPPPHLRGVPRVLVPPR